MTAKKKKGAPVLQVTEPTKDVLDAFEFKSNFLLNNPYFDFKEIGIEDFLDKILCARKTTADGRSKPNNAKPIRSGARNMTRDCVDGRKPGAMCLIMFPT